MTGWDAVREREAMSEKEFEPRLGKIGHKKSARTKPFVRQVLDVAYKSGFRTKRTSSFTGQRIGRGAAWGTLASAGLMRGGTRRAVIKVRIAKLKTGNLGLTDEISDRHYVVVDGVDGRLHYVDIGRVRPEALPEKGMIVSIEAARSQDDAKLRCRLRIQSHLSFEKLAEAEGVTWLDKELLAKTPTPMADQGFGAEIKTALNRRQQWLISQGLGQLANQSPKPNVPLPDGANSPATDTALQM